MYDASTCLVINMKVNLLDVELVEKLQRAAAKAKPVGAVVAKLTSATLSGLVEYGCVRVIHPGMPQLPSPIVNSEMGRAFAEVCSPIGLRANGSQKLAPTLMTSQPYEFIILAKDEGTTASRWTEFSSRFVLSSTKIGFVRKQSLGISVAMQEMADNAVIHSESSTGILVGYQAVENYVACVIADMGIGVLASLRTNERYQHLATHADAIKTALKPGESRYGFGKGGTGFATVFKYAAEARGTLRFRSGEASVSLDGQDEHTDRAINGSVAFRPGFQVSICCRSSDRPAGENLI